jgi:hypothetical protein
MIKPKIKPKKPKKLSFKQKLAILYKEIEPDFKDLPDADQVLLGILPKRELTFDELWILSEQTFKELKARKGVPFWDTQKERFLTFLNKFSPVELQVLYNQKLDGV